jgi:hypothetical protein
MTDQSEEKDRQEFLAILEARLAQGATEYGNKSFNKGYAELRRELLAELEDIAGWSYILWRKIKVRLEALERQVPPDVG